jgi:hypothetical protein
MNFRKHVAGLAACALVLGAAGAANAAMVFNLAPVNNNNGNQVAATATVDVTSNLLTIDLTNLTANFIAPNQILTGLTVLFGTDPTGIGAFTESGSLVNVNSNGTVSAVVGSPTHWHADFLSGDVRVTTIGGGQPDNGIIPLEPGVGVPNGGVGNFDPFIYGTGHFTVALNGLSAAPTVTGVVFNFGTQIGEFSAPGIPGIPGVPEPATWGLMILGFGGAGAALRANRRRKVAAFA